MKAPKRWNAAAPMLVACALGVGAVAGCGEAKEPSGRVSGQASVACPPTPALRAAQSGAVIVVSWSLPSAQRSCGALGLLITAHSKTIDGPAIPAEGGIVTVRSDHGRVKIVLRDFDEPPFSVNASTFSSTGRSDTVVVDVTGGPNVTRRQQQAVRAAIEACRPVASTPKTCPRTDETSSQAAGRVPDLTPRQLGAALREDVRATMGPAYQVKRMTCTPRGTCEGRFRIHQGRHTVVMRYQVRGVRRALGGCWVVTSWMVIRPSPVPNEVLPVPSHGCVQT
jgi:hypothetical protein